MFAYTYGRIFAMSSVVGPFGVESGTGGATSHKRYNDGHGNVVGLYVPERDTNERLTRDQMQFNPNWKTIPQDTILNALNFFDNDKFVQDAVGMKLNHILGGGITFHRRFHKMTPESIRWHSTTYTQLLRQIYRYGLACGFAAQSYKPHPEYVGEPILLDLTRVDIFVLTDMWGRSHFKFFQSQSEVATASESSYEIPNVTIIPFKLPSADGCIKSIADVLQADFKTEMALRQYMVVACKLKCYPPLVTERMTVNTDKAGLYSSYGIGGVNGGVGTQIDSSQSDRISNEKIQQERAGRLAMRELNSDTQGADDSLNSNGVHALMYSNQVYVANDRTVARTEAAQEPNRYIEFSQKRRDDVFAFFSIPPGVVTAGGTGDRSSSSSMNSMAIFTNDQKELKNLFLSMVQTMYDVITRNAKTMDVIMENSRKKRRMDDDAVRSSVETDVGMPGIPEDDVVYRLYWMGALKYDALKEIMAAKHGLAMARSFNPTPTIDIKLLNGIEPKEPKQTTS